MKVVDKEIYPEKEISDSEFVKLRNEFTNKKPTN
jgi:hypothetical protein